MKSRLLNKAVFFFLLKIEQYISQPTILPFSSSYGLVFLRKLPQSNLEYESTKVNLSDLYLLCVLRVSAMGLSAE